MTVRTLLRRKSLCASFAAFVLATANIGSSACAAELPRDMTDQLAADANDEEIVDHLFAVRKNAGVSRAVALHFPDLDRERAYRIQMALLKRMEAAGERLVGWKMGGTKIVKPEDKLDPIFGFMLASDEFKSGSTVSATRFAADTPIIEAEIGFWIGKDLPGPTVSRKQLVAALSGVGGASEIISARLRDPEGGLETGVDIAIADGLSHGGFILPKKKVPLAKVDFSTEEGRVVINGEVIATGAASIMMDGAPLDAVLALANRLLKHGQYLRAGQVVIIGSLLDSPPASAGDHAEIGFSTFESLTIDFK